MGGNSGKNFAEGWVEFEDKRVAKSVAAQLNGNPMGGKRRSAYHYDLWCLKYLSRFKWDHLTEEIGARMPLAVHVLPCSIYIARCSSHSEIASLGHKPCTARPDGSSMGATCRLTT